MARGTLRPGRMPGAGVFASCVGMIAGEGLVGILLAVLAVTGVTGTLDLSPHLDTGIVGGLAFLALMVFAVLRTARKPSA